MTSPSPDPAATFARRLREVRQQAGLTQLQLADQMTAAGHKMDDSAVSRIESGATTHRSTVAKIETGARPVSLGEAGQFATILGVPLLALLTEASDITPERRARLDAQITVRALQHQAAEHRQRLDDAQLLYDAAARRLKAAQEAAR